MTRFSLYSYHKINFWVFQITGWLFFSVYAFFVTTIFVNNSEILPTIILVTWLTTGFGLTLLLRIIFINELFKKQVLILRIGLAVFLPLILSLGWILEWNFLNAIFSFKSRYAIFDSLRYFILDFVFAHGPLYSWTFFYFGIKSWYSFIDQKVRAEKAISMLNYSNLQMLRYQLNPHFLFNSLNSIKALIHENPEMAETTVTSLSDFLRTTLQYNEKLMIPVSEELEIIEKYLKIEKIRYEERLNYSIETDKSILDMDIPCLITQPLVENSIKHGLLKAPEGIKLFIKIFKNENKIVIEVSNSGRLSSAWSTGVGLGNLLDRLENSFPQKVKFTLKEENNLVVARIVILS